MLCIKVVDDTDHTVSIFPVDAFTAENREDSEVFAAIGRALNGETVPVGGGAAPLIWLSAVDVDPSEVTSDEGEVSTVNSFGAIACACIGGGILAAIVVYAIGFATL